MSEVEVEQILELGRLHRERRELRKQISPLTAKVKHIAEAMRMAAVLLEDGGVSMGPNNPLLTEIDGEQLRQLVNEVTVKVERIREIDKLLS